MNHYPKIIQEISKAVGIPPHRDKYRMWHQVTYIGQTAMVFDEAVRGGGYAIIPYENFAAVNLPASYAIEAIQNQAFSLGEYSYHTRKFVPWAQRIGRYPPGYFTHQVG